MLALDEFNILFFPSFTLRHDYLLISYTSMHIRLVTRLSSLFLAIEFLEGFQLLNQSFVLIFQQCYAVFQTLDVVFLLASALMSSFPVERRKSENESQWYGVKVKEMIQI